MNYLSTAILGATAFFLITGALIGFARGAMRSVVRLLTVGVAFAAAWMAKDPCVNALLSLDAGGGKSIAESLVEGMGEIGTDIIVPIVESLLGVVIFIAVFIVASIVTNIAYLILKIIFRSKKNKLVGLIVGALQGALIAFVICAPLNGVICNIGQVLDLEIQGEPVLSAEEKASMKEKGIDFDEYRESAVSKVYTAIGGGFYDALASSEIDGESVSLSTTVEAVEAGTKLLDAMDSITKIDMSNGLTNDSREELRAAFKELNNIKNDMSPEAQETMSSLISSVMADVSAETEVPEAVTEIIENLDFTEVDFEEEGELLITVMDYANGESSEATDDDVTAEDIVNALAESTVIVPMLEDMIDNGEASTSMPEDQKAEFIAAVDKLEDAEKKETLRKILGLN